MFANSPRSGMLIASYKIRFMNKLLFIIIIFSCNNIFATAYPITPRPLRKLVIESDAAIVGKVISIVDKKYEGKKKKNIYYPSYKIAKIVVLEVLQGKVKNDTIEIVFEPNMTCPAPAMYYEKTSVIAFLDSNKNGGYSTHALSYGSKTLDSIGISIYKKRITEIQKILKIQDSVAQKTETIEWLVNCAENKSTSWEGVFELSNIKEFSNEPDNKFAGLLNEDQKARLKKAYMSSIQSSYYDFNLSDLIYNDNKSEIDSILLEALKKLPEKDFYYASDYISRLKHINKSDEMEKLLKKYYAVQFENEKVQERNKIIIEFITLVEK